MLKDVTYERFDRRPDLRARIEAVMPEVEEDIRLGAGRVTLRWVYWPTIPGSTTRSVERAVEAARENLGVSEPIAWGESVSMDWTGDGVLLLLRDEWAGLGACLLSPYALENERELRWAVRRLHTGMLIAFVGRQVEGFREELAELTTGV